jgi:hypothetical protein
MAFILDLQNAPANTDDAEIQNPLSTVSLTVVCLGSTVSLALC